MLSRRRLLWLFGGGAITAGAVAAGSILWTRRPPESDRTARGAGTAANPATPVPTAAPGHGELDLGRISSVGAGFAVLETRLGPRRLRLTPQTVVWFEGNEQPYFDGLVAVGDSCDVSGVAYEDRSMTAAHLTLNPLGNLLGVVSLVEGSDLLVHVVYHNPVTVFSPAVTRLHTEVRTKVRPAQGLDLASQLASIPRGDFVLCTGYRTRDGAGYALEINDEGPATNLPAWLKEKLGHDDS